MCRMPTRRWPKIFTQAVPMTRVAADMAGLGALVVEVAATFMVVCTVPAACDGHGVGGDRAGDGRVRPRKVYTSRAL